VGGAHLKRPPFFRHCEERSDEAMMVCRLFSPVSLDFSSVRRPTQTRHDPACPGHPRLPFRAFHSSKTWMARIERAMTM